MEKDTTSAEIKNDEQEKKHEEFFYTLCLLSKWH